MATQVNKVRRVAVTVGEMCQDRGYEVPLEWTSLMGDRQMFDSTFVSVQGDDEENRIFSVDRQRMTLSLYRQVDGDQLLVFFNGDDIVTVQALGTYRKHALDKGNRNMIVIVKGKLHNLAKRVVDQSAQSEDGVRVQVFEEDDLVVNITRHELVPLHEILTKEETKQVLDAYNLKLPMLPRILMKDPVALYLGLQRGQVVRITRKSESAGEYTTYRQCV